MYAAKTYPSVHVGVGDFRRIQILHDHVPKRKKKKKRKISTIT